MLTVYFHDKTYHVILNGVEYTFADYTSAKTFIDNAVDCPILANNDNLQRNKELEYV